MTLGDGAKKLYRDSGLGLAVQAVIAIATGIGSDFLLSLPGYADTLVGTAVGSLIGAYTAWRAKRGSSVTPTTRLDQ
jgi:hypothetical protein